MAPNLWRLSERGLAGSVLLGERLRRYGPGIVVSSEEPKAVETAEIVAGHLGIGCCVYPGLHEHDRAGVPFLDDEEFWRAARAFFERPDELVCGGETARQAGSRFEGAVRRALDEREEEVVTVVAHGTVISLLIARYRDLDVYALGAASASPHSASSPRRTSSYVGSFPASGPRTDYVQQGGLQDHAGTPPSPRRAL